MISLVKAIVYNSATGFTKEYAEMLSKKINVPCYTLKEAKKELNKQDEIVYLGWICAGIIKGLNKARNKYKVKCYGAVGAFPKDANYIETLTKSNGLEKDKLFYLRGGINFQKLKGYKKLIIKIVGNVLEKNNKGKEGSEELIRIFNEGASFVDSENLDEMINYIKK